MRLIHRQLGVLVLAGALAAGTLALVRREGRRAATRAADADAAKRPFAAVAPAAVREVELIGAAGRIVVARAGAESPWHITAPRALPAEQMAVDALVQGMYELTVSGEVASDAQDLARFGLDPPRTVLTLMAATGAGDAADRTARTLHVGKASAFDGSIYARLAGSTEVLLLPAELAPLLARDLYTLRDKRPLALAAQEITALDVRAADGGFRLERGPGGGFLLTRPVRAGADPGQVDQLLGALTGLRAQAFVREAAPDAAARRPFGLASPEVAVTLTLRGAAAPATLLFGQVRGGLPQPRTFVMRDGPCPVLALEQDWALSRLRLPAQALRDMRLVHARAADVRALVIRRAGAELRLTRAGHEASGLPRWIPAPPAAAASLDGQRVATLLHRLVDLRGEAVAHEQADLMTMRRAGLLPAAVEVDLEGADGASLGGVRIGAPDGAARLCAAAGSQRIDRVAGAEALPISTRLEDYVAPSAQG